MDDKLIQQAVSNVNQHPQKNEMQPYQGFSKIENKVILDRESKKLGNLSENEFSNLFEYLFTLTGLPIGNRPLQTERNILITFLKTNFPYFGVEEIRSAFEMAITDKLSADANHNGYFSGKYIGSILSAYKKFSTPILSEHFSKQQTMPIEKQIENKPECDWTETWEALKNGESAIIPAPVYDWAVKKEFINLTNDQKHELVAKAQTNLTFTAGTLNLPEEQVKELRKRYKNPKDILVLNEAKKIAVREALNKL